LSSAESLDAPDRILVCVDEEKAAERAAEFATALAAKLGSKVFFANVIGASEKENNITADMVGSFEVLGAETLAKCEEMAKKYNVEYEKVELSGDPADEILRFADERKCDCIVLGWSVEPRLEKLLLGSVSEKVLKFSETPVILVKQKQTG
jgi:nucleotide-binding universal stress UspA family protein